METKQITRASDAPRHLQRAAKVALSCGAATFISADGEQLLAKFNDADRYYFDPENVTTHALEAIHHARTYGFVTKAGLHFPLVVRTVFSQGDIRVQIGTSRWYLSNERNTPHALRLAIVMAFEGYYDAEFAAQA
jgi:hypothetical protein